MKKLGLLAAVSLLTGCLGMPEGVAPVSGFELEKYQGKWFEIARLDHSFERGMEQVSAEYTIQKNGTVAVLNRGYLPEKNEWKEAKGKAKFVDDPDQGYLKVSFFGPFYASYVVFGLDKINYDYAFVAGPDTSYLWLMSRKSSLAPDVIDEFMRRAEAHGFNTDELIWVKHDQ